jgi:hypothetical protein
MVMIGKVRPGEFASAFSSVLSARGKPGTLFLLDLGESSSRGERQVCILPDGSGLANPQA